MFVYCWWECKIAAIVANNIVVSQKLNTKLPCIPTISLLGIYSKELTAETQKDIYIPIVTAALPRITKSRNTTNIHRQMDKVWYMCNGISFSLEKK